MIKDYKDYIDSINEGLIKIYPSNIVSNNLINSLIGLNLNFNVELIDNKIKLTFNFFNAIPIYQLDNLFDIINSAESKFDEIVEDIPNKLYHLSINEYKDKIIKYGLYPKSKNKLTSHLDRIYLCDNINDCKILINRMSLKNESY